MLESEAFCSAFIALGCGWEVPDDILPDVEKYVCTLYVQKYSAGDNLFRLTCRSEALPPNQDCLKHHLARANYQIAIHRRALERFIDAPSAVGHGWQVEDGQLVYKWMEKSINCKCKKSDCKGTCSCIKGDYRVLITVSVFGNSVLIDHLMKWLAVEVTMTQTAMMLM